MLHRCTTWQGYATQMHNLARLCYTDAQPGKVMLQRHGTRKGYATIKGEMDAQELV